MWIELIEILKRPIGSTKDWKFSFLGMLAFSEHGLPRLPDYLASGICDVGNDLCLRSLLSMTGTDLIALLQCRELTLLI